MNLFNYLEVVAKRSVAREVAYPLLKLDEVLSNYVSSVEVKAAAILTELALFSRIEVGSVLFLRKGEISVTSIEIRNQTLRVKNVQN